MAAWIGARELGRHPRVLRTSPAELQSWSIGADQLGVTGWLPPQLPIMGHQQMVSHDSILDYKEPAQISH